MSEAGGIEAGPLYVDVVADLSGFGRGLQEQVNARTRGVKATIEATVDTRKAEVELAKVAAKQRVAEIQATAQTTRAETDLATAAAKKRVAEIKAEANVREAEAALARVAAAERVAEIKAEASIARAEADLARTAAKQRVAEIQAEADTAAAEAKLDQAAAKKRTVVIQAEIEDAKAEAELEKVAAKRRIAQIQAEADTLIAEKRLDQATRDRTVHVDIDLDKAGSKLTSFGTSALGLLQFPAIASGISMAAGALAQVASGLFAVAAAAAPAVGILGAIPGLVAGAAQGIGTIITGFSGIGDAMKKSSAAEASAASASASASAQREAAAQRIASAQDRVKQAQASLVNSEASAAHAIQQAQESVTRAHEESARNVQKATQRVADEQQQAAERIAAAQHSLAEAEQTSARDIEQAQQRVTEAHQQAAQNVAQAERQLMSAQQDAVQAQRDLIQAREDAARQLEDLNARTQGGRLSVEGAQISVQRAEIHRTQVFSSATATNLDKQQADLDYREAVQRLHDQQREQARLEEDTKKANKAGVEGSDLVTRAKQRLNDANQKIRDAEAAITKARRDGARQIAQAEQALTQARQQGALRVQAAEANLSKARQDSARQIRDAEDALTQARLDGAQKVAQAEDNLANTRRTSAFSVASAQHAVIEAQQALTQAHQQAGAAATKQGAADAALAAAMAKLSPAGRTFVTFLLNQLIPAWGKVKSAVQQALLPPVQRGLTALLPLMGILQTGMAQTARIVGGAFESLARNYLATPLFKRDMTTIMASNNRAFATLLTALTPIVRAFTDLTVASGPLLRRFADFIARSAILVGNFIHTQRETGGLARFFKLAGDTAAQLGRIVWNLITAIFNIGKAARPAGQKLLDSFEGVTKKWADWTKSMGGQNKLKAYFDHALPIMYELGALIHDIVVDFFDLGKNDSLAGLIKQIRTQALPAIKTLADNLSGAFGKSLVTAISDVATTLADLTDSSNGGGALATFVDTLDSIVKDLDALIKMPGVGPVIGFLASLAGGITAVSLVLGPAVKGLKLMSTALEAVAVRAGLAAEGFTVMGAAIDFAMGPVGLVLAIIAIIGLALYELYQHWAPFHDFIDRQVNGMKTALSNLGKMWTWLSKEVKRELGVLGDDVKRVFGAISDDWDRTKRDVGAMRDSIGRAVDKIKGFFSGLGKSISDWWNHTVKPTWANVRAWWDRTRDSIGHGKDRIVGFFTSLGNSIKDWWNTHVSPIWARVVSTWNTVRDKIGSAIGRIKGFFTSLGKSIQDVYASYIRVYFDAIKTALGKVQDAFRTGVGKIKAFWDGLKAAVANPVKFVIDTIYNNGIRGFWNMVASKVGLPQLDKLTVRGINAAAGGVVPGAPPGRPGQPFATGGMARAPRASGVLPGYAPGVDVVNAVLSPGEGILVPEAVRGLARVMGTGAENAIQTINSSFSSRVRAPLGARRSRAGGLPGFDIGGVFGWVGNQIGRGASAAKNWVGDKIGAATDALKNAVAGALSGPLHAAAGPIHSLINNVLPASPFFSNMLRQGSNQMVDKAIDNIVGKDEAMNAPTGGGAGMGWQQLWSIVKGAFPNAQLLSSFRPGAVTRSGSTSYHALGQAIDVTPSMAIFNWLAAHYRNSRELIFSPANGRQIWNGKPHMYTGPTRADHFNHVHWAGPAGGGGGGGGGGPIPGGGGVARWAGMVKNALARLGLSTSPAMVARVLRQIATESGGNPNAVQGNIGDVNNRSGDLAKGLMQVIGATFRAYHVPGTSWSQFDPWASILAGLNYAKHRYGDSLSFLGQGHGYSLGGIIPGLSRMATGGVATASAHARHLAHLAHIRHLAHLRHLARQVVGPRPRTVVPTHPTHPKHPPTPARPKPSLASLFHTTGDTGRQLLDGIATAAGQVVAPIPATVNSRLRTTGDTGAALLQQLLAQGGRLFDSGGILNPGATFAVNATGANEYILTGSQWDAVSSLAASAAGSRAVVHEPTAAERLAGAQIQIDVHPQPGTDARAVAREVAAEMGWLLR